MTSGIDEVDDMVTRLRREGQAGFRDLHSNVLVDIPAVKAAPSETRELAKSIPGLAPGHDGNLLALLNHRPDYRQI